MVGTRAAAEPELVARLVGGGHAPANHSWDHASFPRLSPAARVEQLARCETALGTGARRLFRPPFGEQSLGSLRDARLAGYTVIGWDVVAEDWRDDAAEVLVARVMRRLRRGSIVVLHDSLYVADEAHFRDRRPTLAALETLLARLAGALRFVTLPELLRLGAPVWEHHYHRLRDEFHRRLV